MSRFKIGPAKTECGKDAWIFEITDRMFGKVKDETWYAMGWDLNGGRYAYPLLPNAEPREFWIKTRYGDELCYVRKENPPNDPENYIHVREVL